jgi:hypothetical protein
MEDSNNLARINAKMTANTTSALPQLNNRSDEGEDDSSDKDRESFLDKDRSDHSSDHDLSLGEYDPMQLKYRRGYSTWNTAKSIRCQTTFCRHCGMWQALLLEA